MHNNTYEAILAYEPLSADLFFERVNELFPEIFTELHTCKDIEGVNLRKSVVLYIAHAYSRESPLVISGLADAKTKKAIAEVVGLPDYLSGPVMLLKDEGVKRCIVKYLEIQKERDWHHLQVKKMQYDYMMSESIMGKKDADGAIDYKFIMDCSATADKLLESIIRLEDTLKSKYKKVDNNLDEIKKISKEQNINDDQESLSIEAAVRDQNKKS